MTVKALVVGVLIVIITPLSADLSVGKLKSRSTILMNAETGAVLYQKKAHKKRYPASITKIATALYAIKVKGDRDNSKVLAYQDLLGWISAEKKQQSNYSLPAHWLEPGASHISLQVGEKVPFQDLLYGMMLSSGDDASNLIAEYVGGSVEKFMQEMNSYLSDVVGVKTTKFINPHGLYHPEQVVTAYEMAKITQEALKDPFFRKIVSTVEYRRQPTNLSKGALLVQGNKLLRRGKYYYPKAIGVKTGYIEKAKHNLVAAAKEGDRTLIAVVLSCENRKEIFEDAAKLFDAAFKEKKYRKVFVAKGIQQHRLQIEGASSAVGAYSHEDLAIDYYPSEEPSFSRWRCSLVWDSVQLPIAKKQKIGQLQLFDSEGVIVKTTPLFADKELLKSWWQREWIALVDTGWATIFAESLAVISVIIVFGAFAWQLGSSNKRSGVKRRRRR